MWHFPMDKESGLMVEVKPLRFRIAQPIVNPEDVRIQLGLDAETNIVTEARDLECAFPDSLIIDPPERGSVRLNVPARAEYDWLSNFLEERTADIVEVGDAVVHIKDIDLRPHGDSLLLAVELSAQTGGWFGARGEETVYVLAKPRLIAESQTLVLEELRLDTESSNVLVAMFGEVMEPILLKELNKHATFDLNPQLEEVRAQARQVFKSVSKGGFELEGEIESASLDRLDVGREFLRIVAKVGASVSGTLRTVELGEN